MLLNGDKLSDPNDLGREVSARSMQIYKYTHTLQLYATFNIM